jgi:HlyD family secretion protein
MMPAEETMANQQNGSNRSLRIPIILLVLLIAGGLVWWFFLRKPPIPQNLIPLSGRIESDDSAVAVKVAGRIQEVTVREGDKVTAGQVIARLDDAQLRARVDQAQSAVDQSEAKLLRARQQIPVLTAQLEQSRLAVNQAVLDARGRVSQAQGQLAAAEAALAQAKASSDQANWDADRLTKLADRGDISEREGKQAITASETQKAALRAAQRQVDATRGALTAAQAYLENPAIRTSQALAVEQQIRQAQADVKSSEADLAKFQAQLREAQENRKDLEVVAPFDATVATRSAEPGEVVSPGTPIVTLVNLGQVYLRGYIPEGEIGKVRVGQPARVFLDSAPDKPIDAYVSRVDPEASFTPENTYFRNDRVKQVVGVKLQLKGAYGLAKPGMPADGEVLVEGNQWPATKHR